jgi:predicted PurR-regulated permease PerM
MLYNQEVNKKKLQLYFFLLFLTVASGLTFWIFLPYVGTLVLAAAGAIILYPVYLWFLKLTGGYRHVAALITMTLGALLFLVPVSFFVYRILQESLALYAKIGNGTDAYHQFLNATSALIDSYLPGINIDFSAFGNQAAGYLASSLGKAFTGTIQIIFQFFIGIVALYYFIIDGPRILAALNHLSPLDEKYDTLIFGRLKKAVDSVLKGTILVALIQGAMAGLGLWFFGVPDASIWGSCAVVTSLIPGVGTAVVTVPAAAYLFANGQTVNAIGLLVYGLLVVHPIDNILRPFFVGRGVSIHPLWILVSVFGGIGFFGPLGFIFGPLVLSLLYGLLEIYRMLVLNQPIKKVLTKATKKS